LCTNLHVFVGNFLKDNYQPQQKNN
jgi:hypothetical protein